MEEFRGFPLPRGAERNLGVILQERGDETPQGGIFGVTLLEKRPPQVSVRDFGVTLLEMRPP